MLETYTRTDDYLRQLWTWLQSQPEYCGRTHMLITTDHGRGHTPKDWKDRGKDVIWVERFPVATPVAAPPVQ